MLRRSKINKNLGGELSRTSEYKRAVKSAADEVAGRASLFASQAQEPWMRRQSETIVVQQEGDEVYVVNTDYGGHLAEWGSKNNPPHAPLRRAVRSMGLEFREE